MVLGPKTVVFRVNTVKFWANTVVFWANAVELRGNTVGIWANAVERKMRLYLGTSSMVVGAYTMVFVISTVIF